MSTLIDCIQNPQHELISMLLDDLPFSASPARYNKIKSYSLIDGFRQQLESCFDQQNLSKIRIADLLEQKLYSLQLQYPEMCLQIPTEKQTATLSKENSTSALFEDPGNEEALIQASKKHFEDLEAERATLQFALSLSLKEM